MFLVLCLQLVCYPHSTSAWVDTCPSQRPIGRGRGYTVLLQSAFQKDSPSKSNDDADGAELRIRPAQYADLGPVAEIILDSFYDGKMSFRGLVKLAELNRLQQNFPYVDKELHEMFVATMALEQEVDDSSSKIVGFVDVDARPCKPEIKLPRPYLSDLCVKPEFRRRGIAKSLVVKGQDFIRNIPRDRLFIRVEQDNSAAVHMYQKLGYVSQGVETTRDKKRVVTLLKIFHEEDSKTQFKDRVEGSDPDFSI